MATLNGMAATFKKIPETTHKALIAGDEVIPFAAQDGTFYYITRDELFNQLGGLTAGFVGVIDTTDILDVDGIYIPETSGIYNNADGLVIDTADGLNLIIKNGSIYQKAVIPVPVPENKIPQWVVGAYDQGDQVLNGGSVWEANTNTSQEPNGASTDWERVVWGSTGNIFMGQVTPASPLNADGIYIPVETGTYTNADGIEVDVTDGFTVIVKNGDNYDKIVYPVSQPLIKNSMDDLRNISGDELMRLQSGFYKFVQLQGYYEGEKYDRPVDYFWDSDSTDADDGGSVIQVAGVATGRFIHNFEGNIDAIYFGVVPGLISDQSAAFSNIVIGAKVGDIVSIPKGDYLGNFVSDKPITLNLNGGTITPANDTLPTISIRGSFEDRIPIVGNPVYGASSFTLNSAGTMLSSGDVIEMTDEAERPADSTPYINNELLKVLEVDGDTVYVEDIIRGTFNTGQVTVRKINSIKHVSIVNAVIDASNTHVFPSIWVSDCENVIIDNVVTKNTSGDAVRLDRCYGGQATNVYVNKPRQTGGGQGYGVVLNQCREISVENIHGDGTRHIIDCKSTYNCVVDKVFEPNAVSSAVTLSHNGFGGHITARNIFTAGPSHAISISDQGFSVTNSTVQVLRDYVVDNVTHIYKNTTISTFNAAVRFSGDYGNVRISNINARFENGVDVTTISLQTNTIRFSGIAKGPLYIDNISANVTGAIVAITSTRTDTADVNNKKIITNLNADRCLNAFYAAGVGNVSISGVWVRTLDDALFRLNRYFSMNPNYIDIGESGIAYTLRGNVYKLISDEGLQSTSLIKGSLPKTTASSSSSVSVSNGSTIPKDRLYNTNKYLRLGFLEDADITLNATTPIDRSLWEGHEINLVIRAAGSAMDEIGGTVVIPANSETVSNTIPIIMQAGYIYRFIFYGGMWNLMGEGYMKSIKSAEPSPDAASDPGAAYSQGEVQAILNELRDLKMKMRSAGLLDL